MCFFFCCQGCAVYSIESLQKLWMCRVNSREPVIAKVPVCFLFSISALFPNYLSVHLVEYVDGRLSPGSSSIAVCVFSLCEFLQARLRWRSGSVSERICGESSSHRGSDDTTPHVLQHMVGYTWLQAIRDSDVKACSQWHPPPPHPTPRLHLYKVQPNVWSYYLIFLNLVRHLIAGNY